VRWSCQRCQSVYLVASSYRLRGVKRRCLEGCRAAFRKCRRSDSRPSSSPSPKRLPSRESFCFSNRSSVKTSPNTDNRARIAECHCSPPGTRIKTAMIPVHTHHPSHSSARPFNTQPKVRQQPFTMHAALIGASRGIGYHVTLNLLATSDWTCTLLLRKPEIMEQDDKLVPPAQHHYPRRVYKRFLPDWIPR